MIHVRASARAARRARPGRGARRSPPAARPRTTRRRRAARRASSESTGGANPERRDQDRASRPSRSRSSSATPTRSSSTPASTRRSKELGGSNRISGPTDAGASSQISIINAAVQQKPDAIIIAGNDPNAVAPALKQAAQRGVKVVGDGLRRRARRAQRVHQPGHDAARRREPGRVDRASRSATRARSRSSRRPRTRPTRTPGSR